MKLKAVAALLVMLGITGPGAAQVVVFGNGVRITYPRGNVIIAGVLPVPSYSSSIYSTTIIYPPAYIPPQPRITVNNFYSGKGPILGPGYDADTRGVDLDLVPLKKPQPREPDAEPVRPLPGVDVSKPRAPVRPDDIKPAVPPPLLPPKEMPLRPPPPLPVPPPPLPNPLDESSRLIDLGLAAFGASEYGLAAQRFRQATEVAPMSPRGYFLLAQAEVAIGNYRDAVFTIHAGMKIDKLWPQTAVQPRLDLYKGRDADYDTELKRLSDAVSGNPNHGALLFLIAHQLWYDGRRADALALFQSTRPLVDNAVFVDAFLAAGGPGRVAMR